VDARWVVQVQGQYSQAQGPPERVLAWRSRGNLLCQRRQAVPPPNDSQCIVDSPGGSPGMIT